MRVKIVDRNPDGRGRGRSGDRVALISQAHPGEEVIVRVDCTTRGTVQGRVATVLAADPRRVAHDCRHEFHCTGCPLLAADPADEAAFKVARLREILAALPAGGRPEPEPLLSPGPLFRYRHFAKQIFARKRGRTILGSYAAGTHSVVDNTACPVLAEPLQRLMDATAEAAHEMAIPLHEAGRSLGLRHALARLSRTTGDLLLVLATSEDPPTRAIQLAERLRRERGKLAGVHVLVQGAETNLLLAGELRWTSGVAWLREDLLGVPHQVGPRSFFQINPQAAEVLFRVAVDAAGGGATCLEGYAGVGALTLPLAQRFARVVAVESSAEAVASLREVAHRLRAGGVAVSEGRAEDLVPRLLGAEKPEVVVLDPPRSGADAGIMEAVAASAARRCVLLSCEPASLGKDLPPLLSGGWRIERIVPVDQFPRTAHLETVVVAVR